MKLTKRFKRIGTENGVDIYQDKHNRLYYYASKNNDDIELRRVRSRETIEKLVKQGRWQKL